MKRTLYIGFLSLLVYLFFAGGSPALAANAPENYSRGNDGVFSSYTIQDGLSQSSVQAILVDRSGRLWIGTQDGLNRYSSGSFVHYKYDPKKPDTISDSNITSILEDSAGDIWVSTANGGVNLYNPMTESFQRFDSHEGTSSSLTKGVNEMISGPDGNFYLGTTAGVVKLDPLSRSFSPIPSTLSMNIESLCFTEKNQLWFGTSEGLFQLESNGLLHSFLPEKINPGTANALITSIITYSPDSLLVLSGKTNLQIFNYETNTFKPYLKQHPRLSAAGYITTLFREKNGTLWIGTYDSGLFRDARNGSRVDYFYNSPGEPLSLVSNSIKQLYQDPQGDVWVGTLFNGVSLYNPERQKFHIVRTNPADPHSLLDNVVRGFASGKESGDLWVASAKGMSYWDASLNQYKRYSAEYGNYPSTQSGSVRGLYRAPDGRTFGLSFSGLSVYSPKTDTFIEYRPSGFPWSTLAAPMICLYIGSDGTEYIGTANGLYVRSGTERHWTLYQNAPDDPHSLVGNNVTRFFETSDRRIWVSTTSGLSVYVPTESRFTNFVREEGNPNSLGGNYVFSLYEDRRYYWLGIQAGGLSRIDKETDEILTFTSSEGLPNSTIYAIFPDRNNRLWLSTNDGIALYDPGEKRAVLFQEDVGAQSREFNNNAYWQSPLGTIFLGGINGFNYFDPGSIRENTFLRPIVFDRIIVKNRDSNQIFTPTKDAHLDLSYVEKDILFEFYSLDFSAESDLHFSYFLEGYDKVWNAPSGKNTAEYTNLPDGVYTFRVKAVSFDGTWSSGITSYSIHVATPPWKSWWAATFFILLIASVLSGILHLAARRQEKIQAKIIEENARLEALVEERTEALKEANRQLEILATQDKLTSLNNRRRMEELINTEIARSLRYKIPFSFIMGDIDFFKSINDTLGHQVGDEILIKIANILTTESRDSDIVGRWGGEEFIILLPETTLQSAANVAERIRLAVSNVKVSDTRQASISLGVVEFNLGDTASTLLHRADELLYEAKSSGRNKVVCDFMEPQK